MFPFLGATATLPHPLPARHALGIAAVFIACYVYLDWATYVYPIRPFAITLWYPPAGLALALLLVFGLRIWPAVAFAVFLADVLVRGIPSPPFLEPLAACVLTAGYVAMAAILRHPLEFRTEFNHLRDVSMLIIVSAFGTLLIAVLYVSVYRVGGLVPAPEFQRAVARFWIGDLIGIVTTTPLLLLLLDWPRLADRLRQRRWIELTAQFCAVILTLWVIFGLKWANEYRLFYLLFLPLIWMVVQHGIVGAAIGIAVIQLGLMAAVEISGYRAAVVLEFQFLMLALATAGLFHGIFVTEQRATREALNSSESRLRAIVSTAPDSIVTVDGKGIIVAANPAASRVFAGTAGDLIGTRVCDLLPEFERVARLGEVTEVVSIRPDGSRFPAELAVGTTGGEAPELRIAIARDITRRREIERQLGAKQAELNRSARLAAAGEMAAALAHELHQPLSAIRNYARASQMLVHAAGANELMQKIEREAARAGEVVQRLRNFFRGGASRLERIGVRQLVEDALQPMREDAMRHRITLETAIAHGEIELLVDRVQIETVLHSLVGNAIEAIATASGGERYIRIAATSADNGWVRLSVVDSGPGISPAIVDRLFEPFATTKPTGIGLGLAMSRSMVEAHGGELVAEPGAGGGTAFHFSLPTADLKEAAMIASEQTVFIVEDSAAVRDSLEVLLGLNGYRTRSFACAEDFLEVYQPSAGCLLLDIRMPGMSGLALQAALLQKPPALPIIVMTAHGDVATVRTALKSGAVDFLEKPVDPDALLAVVRTALDTDSAQRRAAQKAEQVKRQLGILTARERQVMELITKGYNNGEIASTLGISPRTVEVHKARVMEKLQVRSVAELVRIVLGTPAQHNPGRVADLALARQS